MPVGVDLSSLALLALVGVAGGFVNVMAGGGSMLALPALMLLGLDPATANGSLRVALLAQNGSALASFAQKKKLDARRALWLSLAAMPGAVLGAVVAVRIDPLWFKRVFALLLLASLAVMLTRSRSPGGDEGRGEAGPVRFGLALLGALGVGLYGGFAQAGVGLLLMPLLLATLRLDLVRVNALKVAIIGLYNLPALAVFALSGDVNWLDGLALAAGMGLGGFVASRWQIERGAGVVRLVFGFAVLAMALRLLLGGG